MFVKVNAFRGDATNAKVWHHAKLHGMELSSAWYVVQPDIRSEQDFLNACEVRTQWSDPVRVDDGTAEATHALYLKQLATLGCPRWPHNQQDPRRPGSTMSFVEVLQCMPRPNALTIWNITSDGGSDQIKFRGLVKMETRFCLDHLVFDTSCALHKVALITKSALLQADRWLSRCGKSYKYYSSLAKVVHVWRDHSRAVYARWVTLFGAVSANKHAKTVIPRCLAGRWGSVHATQARTNAAGELQLGTTLVSILQRKELMAPVEALEDSGGNPGAVVGIEDPSVEDVKQHKLKMGKYRRDVLACMTDRVWWRVVDGMTLLCQPLQHMLAFFQQHIEDPIGGNTGCRFICGGGRRLLKDFEEIFSDLSWTTRVASSGLPRGTQSDLLCLHVEVGVACAAGFFRRLLSPSEKRCP
jgi:hypothetical protein